MPPIPAGFVPVPAGRARLWMRAGLEAAAPDLLKAWDGVAAEWIEGGRAPHAVVPLPGGGEAVVRRYLRGGAMRHLNRDLYLGGDRAAAELAAAERARRRGVRTPEVVAVGRRPAGFGYRAMIATRRIDAVRDAAALLAGGDAAGRAALLRGLGEQMGAMHQAGIGHPDVNLRNVLVDGDDAVWLIDFDRARLYPGAASRPRRRGDLRRLMRSAAKLGVPLSPADRERLAAGYGPGWPFPAGAA